MARRIRITSKSHSIFKKHLVISWSRINEGKSKFDQNKARKQKEFKSPEGTRREGPPFPINFSTRTQESMAKNPNHREVRERTERERSGARRRAAGFCSGWLVQERREG